MHFKKPVVILNINAGIILFYCLFIYLYNNTISTAGFSFFEFLLIEKKILSMTFVYHNTLLSIRIVM